MKILEKTKTIKSCYLEITRCHRGEFGRNLGGNSSYKPPRVSYIAQGPQKHPELIKYLLTFYVSNQNHFFSLHYFAFHYFPFQGLKGSTFVRHWAKDLVGFSTSNRIL